MHNWAELQKPFTENDIEWRVQNGSLKNGEPNARVIPYLTARAIQTRLDAVVKPENWRNEYKQGPDGGVLCGISIRCSDEWVTKWDGAENTQIEGVKGGLSDSMKRAAVQWGIGRHLYDMKPHWADFVKGGQFSAKIEGKWYEYNVRGLTPVKVDKPIAPVKQPEPVQNLDAEYAKELSDRKKAITALMKKHQLGNEDVKCLTGLSSIKNCDSAADLETAQLLLEEHLQNTGLIPSQEAA